MSDEEPPSIIWHRRVRKLARKDLPHVSEHFLRLGADGLRNRFGRCLSLHEIHEYVQHLPLDRGIHIGCFESDSLRGLLEARPVNERTGHWECVASVEEEWRRKGIGKAMTAIALEDAKSSGAVRVYMRCRTDNSQGLSFLARHASLIREDDGDAIIVVDLGGADRPRH